MCFSLLSVGKTIVTFECNNGRVKHFDAYDLRDAHFGCDSRFKIKLFEESRVYADGISIINSAAMPIGKRFKRGLSSIKANLKNRSELLREPTPTESSVDTTSSVAVSIRKSGESVIWDGKEAASEQAYKPTHDDPACLIADSLTTTADDSQLSIEDDLWFQASEKLKADDPELYKQYSFIIRREADKSNENHPNESAKSLANAATLLKVCQNSLETMNAPSGRADKVFKKTIEIVGLAKDFVGSVVSAEPHGAVAWAGVCLFLSLLLNPSQQDEACRKGLEELPFIIHKYSLVESICAIKSSSSAIATTANMLSSGIIDFYAKILNFQAEVVCQLNRSTIKGYLRKVFQTDKWKNMHHDVLRIEERCWSIAQTIDSDRCIRSELLGVSSQTYQAVVDIGIESKQRERTKRKRIVCKFFVRQKRNPDRVPGTCEWLLKSQAFTDWRDKKSAGLLWISADPGCGKSVLSKAFYKENLVSFSSATIICYFFFKDSSPEQCSITKAVASLLHQLFLSNGSLLKHAMTKWNKNRSELCNLHDDMWDILEDIAVDQAAGDIVCIVDALDECESDNNSRKSFVQRMHKLLFRPECHMRFVITSRPYAQIERIFKGLHQEFPLGRWNLRLSRGKSTWSSTMRFSSWTWMRMLKVNIITRLREMEHRTYLWLHLIMDVIRKIIESSWESRKIDESLRSLPKTVEKIYEEILDTSPYRSETEKLLHIIVGAERPLSTDEINVAMNIQICYDGTQSFDDIHLENRERYPGMLRNLCGLFIQFVDSKVYLVHQTAKEFLVATESGSRFPGKWRYCLEPQETQKILAQICISYLYLSDLNAWSDSGYPKREHGSISATNVPDNLIDYWGTNWVAHYRRVPNAVDPVVIVELCSISIRRIIWLRVMCWMPENYWLSRKMVDPYRLDLELKERVTPLMIASCLNLLEAAKYITSTSYPKENKLNYCGLFGTALSFAVENRSFEMVELLLQKGADANIGHDPYMVRSLPLTSAVKVGDLPIVRLLLENRAVDETGGCILCSALNIAVEYHKTGLVGLLLESAVRPIVEGYLESALEVAVRLRFAKLVAMLLEFGASPTYKFSKRFMSDARSCLSYVLDSRSASSQTNSCELELVLKLLLLKTEPLPSKVMNDLLVEYVSTKSDEVDLVRLLFKPPLHTEPEAHDDGSPIVFAALYANTKSMELLMNEVHDIDSCREAIPWVNKHPLRGVTPWVKNHPLPEGTFGGYIWSELRPMYKSWFTRDIEITALFGGIISANERVVQSLIDHGAGVNMTIELGTPLFIAAALSCKSVVQLLLKNGAQITPSKFGGREQSSPLVFAAARGNIEIVELLLKSGAQVEQGTAVIVHSILTHKEGIEGKFYPSAMEAAEMEGHEDVAALLQEYRARQAGAGVKEVEGAMMPSRVEEVED
ncbi:putative ankyrin repeat protein [Botrytis fragariae]|uniref:Putative ankyrin repeat protein n=1 Tax=Botrytis fragariae TaxID=1964551 RepID=A0A8H6EFP4_9HELO|nr:putative ankyrin repeat protein [Botrytis fragariae]KAF5870542.1 putative ankyrin repeat protein [Botrytis fragariae]